MLTRVVLLVSGAAFLTFTTMAHAFTRDEILLYVPFDGNPQPAVIWGPGSPHIEGSLEYRPGRIGQAVLIGRKDLILHYPTEGNMDPEEGTFSIWVHSLTWDLTEKKNRWWIDVPGPTRFIIYHYLHSSTVFFYHMDEQKKHPSIIKGATNWQPGEWRHLVGTWKKGRIKFYIDGEKIPQEAQVELGRLGEWIRIGTPGTDPDDTLLDEFTVFSRALEDVEVRQLYELGTVSLGATVIVPEADAASSAHGDIRAPYTKAAAVSGFRNRATGLLEADKSSVYLTHDDDTLYLLYSWEIPEAVKRALDNYSFGPLRREARKADADMSGDDSVVLLFSDPEGEQSSIAVNGEGTVTDSRSGDISWSSGTQARSVLNGEAWMVEMAVPLVALSGSRNKKLPGLRILRRHRLIRSDDAYWPGPDPVRDAGTLELSSMREAVQLTDLAFSPAGLLTMDLRNHIKEPIFADVMTDTGEGRKRKCIESGKAWHVEQQLTDTAVRKLEILAGTGTETCLSLSLPLSFPPLMDVELYSFPSQHTVEFRVSTRGVASQEPISVVVSPQGSPTDVVTREINSSLGDERTVTVDTANLPAGSYVGYVYQGERTPGENSKTASFKVIDTPAWIGNSLGIIDYVPKPWTPIRREEHVLSCWGREVSLDNALFPVRIRSQELPILAEPISLKGTVSGHEVTATCETFSWDSVADQKASWTAKGDLGGIGVSVSGWMEFDGLLWFDVALVSTADIPVQDLRLEIPFDPGQSTLFYSGNYRGQGTGLTPEEGWHGGFTPCLGLSNERVGMQWCAQSTRGWDLTNHERALEVQCTKDARILVVHIVDCSVTGPVSRSFSFGLQPTPVKAPLPGRRMIRPRGNPDLEPKPNFYLWWTHYSEGCSYAWPVRDHALDAIRQKQADGSRIHAYTRLCECSLRGDYYSIYRDEWRVHPGPRKTWKKDAEWGDANPVCPGAGSWIDWTLWSFRKACERLGFDGLYYDVSRPPLCGNRHHGCGYLGQDGKWQPEYQLLATRELEKRLWIMFHEDFDGKTISHHMSGHLYMINQAFDDMIIDGENYTSMLKDNYYDLLPLDAYRAEYMGHQWGITSIFLPEFSRAQLTKDLKALYKSPEKLPQVRHLAGMIYLHDGIAWPAFSDLSPYHAIWAAQDKLGWGDDVEFFPYWENDGLLKPSDPQIVVSIFKKENRALCILFNNTDSKAAVSIAVGKACPGISYTCLKDTETGEEFLRTGEVTVSIPIEKRNFRLLLTSQ